MLVLGIESSCDETAAALVEDGRTVLSSVIASQLELHQKYGGVVPEIAARRHAELIGYVVREALDKAGKSITDIDAVAVTARQGLVGCLMVGVAAAKTIAYARQLPLIGVHHVEGHVFANLLAHPGITFPHVCLTVSGGHNMLLYVSRRCHYEVMGTTLDDAAGEAFDKVAKFLGMGFPGGPVIDRLARQGNPRAFQLPRPMLKDGSYDFSFSGLKTAVVNMFRERINRGESLPLADIAASFQEAVVDVLVGKTVRAAEETGVRVIGVTGGVSANSRLREAFLEAAERKGLKVFFPPLSLCTDNAAMIAAAGYARMEAGERGDLSLYVLSSALLGRRYESEGGKRCPAAPG
ncbi:MAG: tRNA (adenosine(37)-N6)-threonylcarbamoyltransferase complex transferase subunit TsaD [Dehalococcoidales bacterium]|nr:tRNA (adenosine(37)-N6)-threonylcarbamoyltransferase complex transferase subunit TsaD [Dehalococcoidales bacterium]